MTATPPGICVGNDGIAYLADAHGNRLDIAGALSRDPEFQITYVAGPMTGMPEWNVPAFAGVAARLRALGLAVVNPHELHESSFDKPYDWYMRRDLAELVKCQRVVLLPGWGKSRGATMEHAVAKDLGMEVIYPEHFEDWAANVK